jgi:CRISPR-associated protein Cmr3
MQSEELLFPMPRHVVGYSVAGRFQPVVLLEPSRAPVLTDCGEIALPVLPVDWRDRLADQPGLKDAHRKPPPEPAGDLYVTRTGMSKILSGHVPDADDCRRRSDLFAHENRVGIRRDESTRTTGQGDLYSPRYVRLQRDVSLLMAIRGVPMGWKLPSLMPLGGESRLAGVEMLRTAPALPQASGSTSVATVTSVTPTRFRGPWWGAGPGDDAARLGGGRNGRVTTVALDRPRMIGGWDSRSRQPLPLAPFTPAGTVWWFDDAQHSDTGIIQLGDTLQTKYGHGLAFVTG